jgi:hypothetical protein
MQIQSSGGFRGHFEVKVLDASGTYKKGMDPRITPEEVAQMPVKYKLTDQHNMVFRRGIAFMLYHLFSYNEGYGGLCAPWTVPEITSGYSTNPFQYLVACDSVARPNWQDSDASDCVNKGTTLRGIGMTGSSGYTDWKWMSHNQYSSPYKDAELVTYVYPTSGVSVPRGLDNYQINSLGFANADTIGGATLWGLRSVLGRPPRYQAIADQYNVAEGTGLVANPTNTSADGYIASTEQSGYEGDHLFDGVTADYGLTGAVNLGNSWYSNDVAGPHKCGRVWTVNKKIKGARIVIPANVPFANVPNRFKFQYLTGTDPTNDAHWTDIPGGDLTGSDQANNIYGAEEFGYDFSWTAVTTKGIRVFQLQAYTPTGGTRIAELMFWEEVDPAGSGIQLVSGVSDALRLAVEFPLSIPTYRSFSLGNIGPTKSMATIVAAINAQIYGYEMEAVRGPFGHLWLQATPNGANSLFQDDTLANGSTANTALGLGATPTQKTGVNVPVTKAAGDAMTITYRYSLDARV